MNIHIVTIFLFIVTILLLSHLQSEHTLLFLFDSPLYLYSSGVVLTAINQFSCLPVRLSAIEVARGGDPSKASHYTKIWFQTCYFI